MKKKTKEDIRLIIREEMVPVLLLLQKPPTEEKILTRSQAMELLGISSTKMWQMVRGNEITHTRVGRTLRFLKSDIMEMLNTK